jgi:hypothetical protein
MEVSKNIALKSGLNTAMMEKPQKSPNVILIQH